MPPKRERKLPPILYKATAIELPPSMTASAASSTAASAPNVKAFEKIRKMLERGLHANTGESEAKAAMSLAARYMKQYNITQADLVESESTEERQQRAGRSVVAIRRADGKEGAVQTQGFVDQWLVNAMRILFKCKSYNETIRSAAWKKIGLNYTFYGIAENTASAAKAFEYVYNLVADWARRHQGKKDYCEGVGYGFYRKAKDERQQEEADARKAETSSDVKQQSQTGPTQSGTNILFDLAGSGNDRTGAIQAAKAKILHLQEKLARVEAQGDMVVATDLKLYAIPDWQDRLASLERNLAIMPAATTHLLKDSNHLDAFSTAKAPFAELGMLAEHDSVIDDDRFDTDHDIDGTNLQESDDEDGGEADFDINEDDNIIDINEDLDEELKKFIKPEPGEVTMYQTSHYGAQANGSDAVVKNENDVKEDSMEPEPGSIWQSSMQLAIFIANAEQIADDYLKEQNIRLKKGGKAKTHVVKNRDAYSKGLEDGKKIDVRRKRIMDNSDDKEEGDEPVLDVKRIKMSD